LTVLSNSGHYSSDPITAAEQGRNVHDAITNLSVRAVPAAEWQCAQHEVRRHLAALAAVAGGAFDHDERPARLLEVRAREQLFALPGARAHGRQHAGAVGSGLREVVCADGGAVVEPAGEQGGGCGSSTGHPDRLSRGVVIGTATRRLAGA